MDSKRTLHTMMTTATVIAVALAGSAATAAWGESERVEPDRPAVEAPVVKVRTWRTSAQPRISTGHVRNRSKGFALDQVVRRSWPLREFRCLDHLWTRESNWNHRAVNRSSGAYGIPQALPAGKMRGAGRDWRHNPKTQIRWGLAYIKGRYGKPCGAWGHFRAHNWY